MTSQTSQDGVVAEAASTTTEDVPATTETTEAVPATTEDEDDLDDGGAYDFDPEYEARKHFALDFLRFLVHIPRGARKTIAHSVGSSEIEAGRYVMAYLTARGDAAVGSTIRAQVDKIRLLSLFLRLWIHHSAAGGTGTIGASLALAKRRDSSYAEFLLRSAVDTETTVALLETCMPAIVNLHKGAGVPVNWARLLIDLDHWRRPQRPIQARWIMDFFGGATRKKKP